MSYHRIRQRDLSSLFGDFLWDSSHIKKLSNQVDNTLRHGVSYNMVNL